LILWDEAGASTTSRDLTFRTNPDAGEGSVAYEPAAIWVHLEWRDTSYSPARIIDSYFCSGMVHDLSLEDSACVVTTFYNSEWDNMGMYSDVGGYDEYGMIGGLMDAPTVEWYGLFLCRGGA
jgi:hypothetical protein